jgi:hypothetical protein
MPRRPLWRKLGTGFRAVEDMADAVRVRRVQARFVVIEIERALRFEPDESLADGPILRSHLQVTYLEGVHDSMHVLIQAGLLDFDGNPGRMGIRHEMHALTLGVEMPQKLLGMRRPLPFDRGQKAFHARPLPPVRALLHSAGGVLLQKRNYRSGGPRASHPCPTERRLFDSSLMCRAVVLSSVHKTI